MKKTLFFSDLIHSFKFADVLLSSSIMPILQVYCFIPKTSSTLLNIRFVKAVSSGPCIFGLTIYIDPFFEFFFFFKSCNAAAVVINASIIPSGTSLPSFNNIEGLVIRCPTFLIKSRLRPRNFKPLPSLEIKFLSGFNFLSKFLPFFSNCVFKSPFIKPNQFL